MRWYEPCCLGTARHICFGADDWIGNLRNKVQLSYFYSFLAREFQLTGIGPMMYNNVYCMNYGNAHVNRADGSIFIESKPWMMDLRNNLKDYADLIKKVDP